MVSILVVLDDALVQVRILTGVLLFLNVSILVVLDDALVLAIISIAWYFMALSQSLLCWTML